MPLNIQEEKNLTDKERFMREAIRQAKKAEALEEVPIGCVIVYDGKIIARGYNRRNTDKNTLSHAELNAIRKASKKLGDWRLEGCTMYVTLEPCQMCAGALVQSRIDKVVIGSMNPKAGCAGSVINILEMDGFNHKVEVERGILEEDCSQMLTAFFKKLREKKKMQKREKKVNCKKEDMLLYAVTDRSWLKGESLYSQIEKALKGGATFVQLREKTLTEEEFMAEAKEIRKLCRKYKVPFIINDNVDIALAVDADGVHVGQSDMEAGEVRKKLGPDKIIGVSARTVEQALLAQEKGADYLGVGAVYSTGTKLDARELPHETLKAICEAVTIPVVAIGGITKDNIAGLKGSGVDGVAVVSAIFAQENIEEATKDLRHKAEEMIK